MADGDSFLDAVSNIDGMDVAIAAAASSGISAMKNIGTLTKLIGVSGTSIVEGAAQANSGDKQEEYSLGDAAVDGTLGTIAEVGSDLIKKAVKSSSKTGKALTKTADKLENMLLLVSHTLHKRQE